MNPRREEEVDVKADVPARDVRYIIWDGASLVRVQVCLLFLAQKT